MYGNGSVFPVPEEDDGQSAEEAVVQASGLLNFTGKLKVKVCLHRACIKTTREKKSDVYPSV